MKRIVFWAKSDIVGCDLILSFIERNGAQGPLFLCSSLTLEIRLDWMDKEEETRRGYSACFT